MGGKTGRFDCAERKMKKERRREREREETSDWIWSGCRATAAVCSVAEREACVIMGKNGHRRRANRVFREDSEVQNKSSVTMEHRSAPSQSGLRPSHQI